MNQRTASRVANALLIGGAVVGVATATVWALGVPLNVPPWLLRIAFIKLAVIGAGGLFAAGAMLGRYARTSRQLPSSHEPAALSEPLPDTMKQATREQERRL